MSELFKGGKPIREWIKSRDHLNGVVRSLSEDNKLTASAIYNYVESDRDIRVSKDGMIYEIKPLWREKELKVSTLESDNAE